MVSDAYAEGLAEDLRLCRDENARLLREHAKAAQVIRAWEAENVKLKDQLYSEGECGCGRCLSQDADVENARLRGLLRDCRIREGGRGMSCSGWFYWGDEIPDCPVADNGKHRWHKHQLQHAVPNHRDEVCCHCGVGRCVHTPPLPAPEGHGPYY